VFYFQPQKFYTASTDMIARVGVIVEKLGSCLLLAVAAPVIAAAALLILAVSRRSPFIAHLRVGHHGRALWLLKLRTMWDKSPALPSERGWLERIVAEPAGLQKSPADSRISNPVAAFCRRHSIDELPQLFHVITGEMSLVGPRPLTASELAFHYGCRIPQVLSAKPGLTGLWQTQGRSALDWPTRVTLDIHHLRSRSLRFYFEILYRTFPILISGRGAW
jgi:exopolysaccharide production protein ExoY